MRQGYGDSDRLRPVLALAAGALIAGCGGDDAPTRTPADAVTAPSSTAVRIGTRRGSAPRMSEASATRAAEDEDAETCEEGLEKAFASEDAEEELAPLEGAEIGEATIDGDTATVAVTSADGQEGEFTSSRRTAGRSTSGVRPIWPRNAKRPPAGGGFASKSPNGGNRLYVRLSPFRRRG